MIYCALIADVISSKKINHDERRSLQIVLSDALNEINNDYSGSIAAGFTLTLGDEFQGLLSDAGIVYEIAEKLQHTAAPYTLRFGIGIGEIYTDITRQWAIAADGPAYYMARESLEFVKSEKIKNDFPVYIKTGGSDDGLLNTALEYAAEIFSDWSDKQRHAVFAEQFGGQTREETAQMLNISTSSLSRRLTAAKYDKYIRIKKILSEYLHEKYRQEPQESQQA